MSKEKHSITHKKEYTISIAIINAVFILFGVLNFVFSYKNSKSANIEKSTIISENAHDSFEDELARISSYSRNTFLNKDFLCLQDDIETNREGIVSYLSSTLDSSSSIVIGSVYLPRINDEIDVTKRIYAGQGEAFWSANSVPTLSFLNTMISISKEDEFQNGKLYPVFENGSDLIVFARNVKDIRLDTYGKKLGIGVVSISRNAFLKPFSLANALNGLDLAISVNDQILFSTNSDLDLSRESVYRSSLNFNGYYMSSYYDTSFIFKDLAFSLLMELGIYLIIIIAFMVIYSFLHKDKIKSLEYLFESFDSNKNKTELKCLGYVDNDEEVNKVIKSYNQMVVSITNLNEKIALEKEEANTLKLKNKEFEIENLYSQINKHFIINILSVTHSLINLKDIDKANYCLESLSDYLRYSLSFNIKETTLRNEVESIKSYINLQLIRYENINVNYDIDNDALEFKTPKLVIQPLVENAFVHGLKSKKGVISISVKKDECSLMIMVKNSGGMDESRLNYINESIQNGKEIKDGNHGVALVNIYKRMHLMYGDKARVYLTSNNDETSSIIEIMEGKLC